MVMKFFLLYSILWRKKEFAMDVRNYLYNLRKYKEFLEFITISVSCISSVMLSLKLVNISGYGEIASDIVWENC